MRVRSGLSLERSQPNPECDQTPRHDFSARAHACDRTPLTMGPDRHASLRVWVALASTTWAARSVKSERIYPLRIGTFASRSSGSGSLASAGTRFSLCRNPSFTTRTTLLSSERRSEDGPSASLIARPSNLYQTSSACCVFAMREARSSSSISSTASTNSLQPSKQPIHESSYAVVDLRAAQQAAALDGRGLKPGRSASILAVLGACARGRK